MSKSTVLLEHHLKQLKLPSMLREYAKMAKVCQSERAEYQTYLPVSYTHLTLPTN